MSDIQAVKITGKITSPDKASPRPDLGRLLADLLTTWSKGGPAGEAARECIERSFPNVTLIPAREIGRPSQRELTPDGMEG